MNTNIFIFFTGAFFGATLDLVLLIAVSMAGRKDRNEDDDEK